jgi:hypothetical protein
MLRDYIGSARNEPYLPRLLFRRKPARQPRPQASQMFARGGEEGAGLPRRRYLRLIVFSARHCITIGSSELTTCSPNLKFI